MSRVLTTIAYVAGAAVTIIMTGGIAVPAWVVPALTGVGVVAGHLATSPSDQKVVDTAKLVSSISSPSSPPPDISALAGIVAAAQAAGKAADIASHQKFVESVVNVTKESPK